MTNYINPGEYWGMSDITQIKEGQKELNKIQAMVIDAMKRDVYREKFVLKDSGIDPDTYVVTQDSMYESRVANPVQEVGKFGLPPEALSYGSIIEAAIEKTAGTAEYNPPSSGNLPSGRSLQELQEVTQTRLRQKIRNLDESIRLLGVAWLEMILKNYTESRIMRTFNSLNNKQEYVYVFNEKDPQLAVAIKEQVSRETVAGSEQVDPRTGQPAPNSGTPKYQHLLNLAEIKGGIDVKVSAGSTVSVSKVATFEQAAMLYKFGVLDQEALLEAADYPDRENIIRR